MPQRLLRSLIILALLLGAAPAAAQGGTNGIGDGALRQIAALIDAKAQRSATEQKIDSQLMSALDAAAGVAGAASGIAADATLSLDVSAVVSAGLLKHIVALGGSVASSSARFHSVRATLPLARIREIAARSDVVFVRPAQRGEPVGGGLDSGALRQALGGAVAAARDTSEGDVTHRAAAARAHFGIDGSGITVGVLSDGVNSLAALRASSDLPEVTILQGQAGNGDEGAAMLEIVHDLAPGAKLYFATADPTAAQFAENILALRAAGCDIIIDDYSYFNETAFQKGQAPSVISGLNNGIITEAVNTVSADGALYFSSAANSGNKNDGLSGTWEGDFASAGAASAITFQGVGELHDFDSGPGVAAYDVLTQPTSFVTLKWDDPIGGSANDYDLFALTANGSAVIAAGTNLQVGGTGDSYEQLPNNLPIGTRLVVVKRTAAAARYLRLDTHRAQLQYSTAGSTFGHNAPPHPNSFGVAAAPAAISGSPVTPDGPFPGVFTAASKVEGFSSDGPRRYFFNADGSAITANNFLAATNGGELLQKPDITAADGVRCNAPGFDTFYGTSAAAPHAGAMAALIASSNPALTPQQIRAAMVSTAIDIEAPGTDRDSGAGIVDVYAALEAMGAPPRARLTLGAASTRTLIGDGDAFFEPSETVGISVTIANDGAVATSGVSVTLTSGTSGFNVVSDTVTLAPLAAGASGINSAPLKVALAGGLICGAIGALTLTVRYNDGAAREVSFPLPLATGSLGAVTTTTYSGPAVAIPDDAPPVRIPLTVSGASGPIADVNFVIGGTSCTAAAGATTVGIDHTFVGDLVLTLTSPSGTKVTLIDRMATGNNSGNNLCQTVLDDAASGSIQDAPDGDAPFSGAYRPASSLSAFAGESANGVWTLEVADTVADDTGSVRGFGLQIQGYSGCDAPARVAAQVSVIGGAGQLLPVGAQAGTPLRVLVRADDGTPLSGATVTFTAPESGPGGSFGGARSITAPTGLDGVTSAPTFTANALTGAYGVQASVAGGAAATFALKNVSSVSRRLYLPWTASGG